MTDPLPVSKWSDLTKGPDGHFVEQAFTFGTSIWFMSTSNTCVLEFMEYDCITDTFNEAIPYPIQIAYRSVCTYKDDTIVIAANNWGIITFNTNTKLFSEPVKMPDVGNGAIVIAVGDYIHIFHGHANPQRDCYGRYPPHKYIVFSMKDGAVQTFEQQNSKFISVKAIQHDRVGGQNNNMLLAGFARIQCRRDIAQVIVSLILKYLKITEFYKFGGSRRVNCNDWGEQQKRSDAFFVGQMQDNYGAVPLEWTQTAKYSLKTKEGFLFNGIRDVFQSDGNIVFIGYREGNIYISIIGANGEQQLMRRSLPLPNQDIRAIALDHQQKLHLFGIKQLAAEKWERVHYCIPLQVIIENIVVDESVDS